MPGGEREGFTFTPYQQAYDDYGLIVYYHPYFTPDAGVTDSVSAPDALLTFDQGTGGYYAITDSGDIDYYNPADPMFGGTYTVTNLTGLGSTLNANTGKLLSMKGRNNNSLNFSSSAITSNTGKSVSITRDPMRAVSIHASNRSTASGCPPTACRRWSTASANRPERPKAQPKAAWEGERSGRAMTASK